MRSQMKGSVVVFAPGLVHRSAFLYEIPDERDVFGLHGGKHGRPPILIGIANSSAAFFKECLDDGQVAVSCGFDKGRPPVMVLRVNIHFLLDEVLYDV